MPRFEPAEFGRLLARLTPQELRQAEGLVADARKRAEAVLEIDARAEAGGPAASCPRCGGDARTRWGRTRTGTQRWNCSGCGVTWSGRSGTPLARVHHPDLVVALARDMIEAPQPMSCRRGAEVLGASRHSIWRWRMAIIGALKPEPDATLAGIVEADEAHQRESRKGSREWVRHRRDPVTHPVPPGLVRSTCSEMLDHIGRLSERLTELDKHIARLLAEGDAARLLRTMPGVGPVTALAIETFAPAMDSFRNGRDFAAWLGLVPRQHSTGGRQILGKTSKMGQSDIRRLLIIGAMAVVGWASRKPVREGSWLARMLARKPRMLVAIALANKMARGIWAMLTKGEEYRGEMAVA